MKEIEIEGKRYRILNGEIFIGDTVSKIDNHSKEENVYMAPVVINTQTELEIHRNLGSKKIVKLEAVS